MAITTEEIIIDLELNADPSTKSINELESQLANLKDALKNVAVGSDDFKKLQAEVIKADSRMKNLNKSIEGLDTEGIASEIGKLAGGISAAFTGVAAVIGNGSEEFEKFTKNIVTGIAITQGIKGAFEGWTAAMRLLNLTMAANPIGIMITAVAALSAGIYILVNALKDTRTEQEKLNDLLKLNTSEYKAFESAIRSASDALIDAKIAYSDTIESADAMELKIQKIIQAEKDQVKALKETAEERKKQLQQQIADISQLERITNPQETYNKIRRINREIRKEDEKVNKAKQDLAEVTSIKLNDLLQQNTKAAKEADEERLKSFTDLQDKIIKAIRASNNRILALQLDIYQTLNFERQGLADFEIDLLERNFALNKRLRNQELADTLDDIRVAKIENEAKYKEDERNAKDAAALRKQIAQEAYNDEVSLQIKKLKANKISKDTYDIRVAQADKKLSKDKLKIEKDLQDKLKVAETLKLSRSIGINQQIAKLRESASKEELAELNNLEAQKIEIRKRFAKQLNIDLIEVRERLAISQLEQDKIRTENIKDVVDLEKVLTKQGYDNIIDLEEKIALKREENSRKEIIRAKEETIERLKLIQPGSEFYEESLKLRFELQQEVFKTNEKSFQQEENIRREFAEKRIQLDKDILKAQINSLQTNLDRELKLREGHWSEVAELTKRKLDSQKTLELMAAEEKYKQDLLLAVNNKEKQEEITWEFENTKALIEEDYRKKKIAADIEGYKKVMEVGEQLFGNFQEILMSQTTARIEEELETKIDALDTEAEALDGAVEAGIMTEEAKEARLKEIEKEREQAQKRAAYDQAKAEKEQALVKVAIDTATAVVEAAPVVPLQIQAGILGAAQAAVIASQPLPQLKKGGKIKGPKHHDGGVPLYQNGTQIAEVEGGELIMTAGVANSPILLNAASMINQMAGGVSFNDTNLNTPIAAPNAAPSINVAAIVQETIKGVTSIPVVNVATNTTKVDKKVKNIEAKSKF